MVTLRHQRPNTRCNGPAYGGPLTMTLDSNTPPIPAPIHFILNGTHRVPLNAINSVSVALGSIPLMEKPHQNVGRHVSQVSSCAFWKFHNLAHLGILAV